MAKTLYALFVEQHKNPARNPKVLSEVPGEVSFHFNIPLL